MRLTARRTLIVLAVAVASACAWAVFHAGTYLQHEDPLRHADAIYVLGGSRFERALEAADLYREGDAPVILLSPGREESAEAAIRARGIAFPRESDPVRDVLVALGVPHTAILIGDRSVDNTAEEAAALRVDAARHGWHTVIVVTSKYHTRRAGFAMRRALAGTGIAIVVRATRYDTADPAHWWRQRRDVRFLSEEWPKLVAYSLGLSE